MAGEPILIVDDTPVNLKLTRILLVNEGYKVMTAASAEEALELLRSYHPRLILADIQLPGIDGLELTRRIKKNEQTRDITGGGAHRLCHEGRRTEGRRGGLRRLHHQTHRYPLPGRAHPGTLDRRAEAHHRRNQRRHDGTRDAFRPPKCRRCAAAS